MSSASADQKRVSEVTTTLSDALVTAIWSGQSFQISNAQGNAARLFYSMVVDNDALSAIEKRTLITNKVLNRTLSLLVKKEAEQLESESTSIAVTPDSFVKPSAKRISSTAETLSAVSEEPWNLDYRLSIATPYLAGDDDDADEEDFEEEEEEGFDREDIKQEASERLEVTEPSKTDDGLLGDSYDSSVDALIVSKTEGGLIVMGDSVADKSSTIKSIASDTSSEFEKIEKSMVDVACDTDTRRQKRRDTLKGESLTSVPGLSPLISGLPRMMSVALDSEFAVRYLSQMKHVKSSLMSNPMMPVSVEEKKSVSLVSVGRAEENDICTDPLFSGVSRIHGYLMQTDSSLLWIDLWSRFGSSLIYRSDSTQSLYVSEAETRHIIVLGKEETALIRLAEECDLLINPDKCLVCQQKEDGSLDEGWKMQRMIVPIKCSHPVCCSKCFREQVTAKKACPLCKDKIDPIMVDDD